MALVSMGGIGTHTGFAVLACLWLATAALALRAALRRDFVAHRRWMARNYSLTFAAVTLRIELPFMVMALGLPFLTAYAIVAWPCWVPNAGVAEAIAARA